MPDQHADFCSKPDVDLEGLHILSESEGRWVWADEDGTISHNCISSEAAGALGSQARRGDREGLADALVALLEIDDPNLEVWIKELANAPSGQRIKAAELALKLAGMVGGQQPPAMGERCALCNQVRGETRPIQILVNRKVAPNVMSLVDPEGEYE